jgi:putative transposase
LRRLDLMRESRDWQAARQMPKSLGTDTQGKQIVNKERTQTFRVVIECFDFTVSAIEKHGKDIKNSCFIGDHVTSLEAQAIARRAFDAVQQYAFGKRGRPRFKPKGRLRSVEGKNQQAGIKLRDRDGKLVIE